MRSPSPRRLVTLALSALVTAAPPAARAQDDFAKVEIKATNVAGNIWMLEGAGGNIAVSAGPDGLLIVDDQFAPLAPKIRAAMAKIAPAKLEFVLNTHWHGDHTGGNAEFGREAPIIAHSNVRKRLSTRQNARGGRVVEPSPKEALPVITFDDSLSVHFNGEEIRVLHLPPGHTDGDSVIEFTGSKVVHMGDHFFAGRFPFVDLGSGGDVEGYARNVEQMAAKIGPDVRIIPGHGPLSGIAELKTFQRMLRETTAVVRDGIAAGKTLAQLQEAGLPAEWKDWGSGFIDTKTWIEIVHTSLTRGAKRE